MVESVNPVNRFRQEISKLIEEIEGCIRCGQGAQDREYDLQQRAFEERRSQARQLTDSLGCDGSRAALEQWATRDGDAHRIHESLQLSLDFFRNDLGD